MSIVTIVRAVNACHAASRQRKSGKKLPNEKATEGAVLIFGPMEKSVARTPWNISNLHCEAPTDSSNGEG